MKKLRTRFCGIFLAFIMIISLIPVSALAESSGWMEQADTGWYQSEQSQSEYTLTTAAQLAGLAKLVNEGNSFQKKTIKLGADLDLNGRNWTPIGTSSAPFQGTFEGTKNGQETYTISNLSVTGSSYLGLFGSLKGAKVQNLTLSHANVSASGDNVGVLAGSMSGTTLANVAVTIAGVISTKTGYAYVGGLVGNGFTGAIQACTVDHLTLSSRGSFVGGISGQGYASIQNTTVNNSSVSSTNWKVGGIIGQLNEGSMTFEGNQVLNTTIASTSYSGSVGGIIGFSNYGTKTLINNKVERVTIQSHTGAGGLIGSISSSTSNSFSFTQCSVQDLTFQSDGTITKSGGLIGEVYWRGSSGSSFQVNQCKVSDIKANATQGSKVGALFGEFSTSGNTYSVSDITIDAGKEDGTVSKLVGSANLGTSTFELSGSNTRIDSIYAGEAVDYLPDNIILKPNDDGGFGVENVQSTQKNYVALNRDTITYYESLGDAFSAAVPGSHIAVLKDISSTAVSVEKDVTLEPGSHTLPDITVSQGANLTISGSNTLKTTLTNQGTVTVDQDTTVTGYSGNGKLATNLAGKRVRLEQGTKLVLEGIPYVFEVNGTKYETMEQAAGAMGASWNPDSHTLTLQQNVTLSGPVGILSPAGNLTLELNGYQIAWPMDANPNGTPLIVGEAGTTLTVQDSSAAQSGRLTADKSNVFQGQGSFVLKSGTFESKADYLYYPGRGSHLDILGGTVLVPEGKFVSKYPSYVTIRGGTFNVLPQETAVANGWKAVKLGDRFQIMDSAQLESGISHGAVLTAKVGDVYYASLQAAVEAAKSGGTVDLLADLTVPVWNQVWDAKHLTIRGNGHTLTVEKVESNGNGNYLFYQAEQLHVSQLTVRLTQGNGFSMLSGKLDHVQMYGNGSSRYGVFVGVSQDQSAKAEISHCTLEGFQAAVYSQPGTAGKVTSAFSIQHSNFAGCGLALCSYSANTVFTGNTVDNCGEISFAAAADPGNMASTYTVTGNDFRHTGKIWFYQADLNKVTFQKNKVDASTVISTESAAKGTLNVAQNYWGGSAPSRNQIQGGAPVSGTQVYYVSALMLPQDLHTPSSSPSVSGKYSVSVSGAAHGAVTVKPGRADKGDLVTITVKPDKGYRLDTLTVTEKSGQAVKTRDKGNGSYTFLMPNTSVTVKAIFSKVPVISPSDSFVDIQPGAWYRTAVDYALKNGLMSGTSSYSFEPNATLSRGMIAQMLYALAGKPKAFPMGGFADVPSSAWYAKAANWTQSKGIITGYDAVTFGPNDPVTREQLALILFNYAKLNGHQPSAKGSLNSFHDGASTSAWAQHAMTWAVGAGLLSGKGEGMLDPTGTATRAEVAQIMMNFRENM